MSRGVASTLHVSVTLPPPTCASTNHSQGDVRQHKEVRAVRTIIKAQTISYC